MEIIELKKEYKKFGFCKIKNFFDKKTCKKLKKYSDQIKKEKPIPGKIMKYYEKSVLERKKNILVRAEFFYDFHIGLKNFIKNKKIHNLLNILMDEKCLLFKEKINFKPPGCRADKVHQDSQGGWSKYSKKFISFLVSIEKSTIKNSCLEFDVSGNNKDFKIGKDFQPLSVKNLNKPKFKKIPLNEGDVVFFNHYIPHRSPANLSKKK
jgi:ectoine hydroxylase-related dioxygenase (phytanoyl-CoA dioxygenase family)